MKGRIIMKPIMKAGALIFQNKKLLITKSFKKPFYINPGGKYEEGETPNMCLERELKEELQVGITSCKHYKTYEIQKAAHSDNPLILELYVVTINGSPIPSAEIEKIDWLTKRDFEQKKYNLAPSFYEYVPDLIKDNLL